MNIFTYTIETDEFTNLGMHEGDILIILPRIKYNNDDLVLTVDFDSERKYIKIFHEVAVDEHVLGRVMSREMIV
ncbi:hypothetical protein [Chengkuizengella axinellae]|uniref:Uncharacterized protein n=1 Tax=Chengkuizengella axinellae TaxID=3064388 RepID=A0ABT9J0U9_9BACL|nr:hypothetical protein [Chengkuizengella sp. 2205SS18-9]MDP5275244.1 hypothetical protein [Chengkuizengella sp. 2205SS18-9]